MKYLAKHFFLFLLAVPSSLFAQSGNEELLDWTSSRKLTWADYKAKPNTDNDAAASTTTYLGIDYNISNTSFSYKIESRFSKTRSWGLHKTDYILSHEQGHFDIAEIFARKLHKEIAIIDTAGRLQVDEELMSQLVDVRKSLDNPEVLIVADAMTGQEAVNVAKVFHEKVGLTGVVLSKMDSDARGGAALSIRYVTNVPIKFISVGEKLKDLEAFQEQIFYRQKKRLALFH